MAQIRINITFIWNNGIEKEAIYLDAVAIQDNLETEAKFYYQLLDENYNILIAGNISIVILIALEKIEEKVNHYDEMIANKSN